MYFLRVVAVLCGTAILLALAADTTIFLLVHHFGSFGTWWHKGRPSPWIPLFSVLWIVALVIGLFVARKLRFSLSA